MTGLTSFTSFFVFLVTLISIIAYFILMRNTALYNLYYFVFIFSFHIGCFSENKSVLWSYPPITIIQNNLSYVLTIIQTVSVSAGRSLQPVCNSQIIIISRIFMAREYFPRIASCTRYPSSSFSDREYPEYHR